MTYKEEIINQWNKAGGLITKIAAARILGVSQSVITRRSDIKKYQVGKDEYVSYTEIINREDIKPRAKRKQK